MSDKDFIDFTFRYRPNTDSPDGILFRYLQSFKPIKRRHMILKALRAFYLVAAYGAVEEFHEFEQVKDLVELLEKTYGEGADGTIKDSLSFNIDLEVSYMGMSSLPESDESDEDE